MFLVQVFTAASVGDRVYCLLRDSRQDGVGARCDRQKNPGYPGDDKGSSLCLQEMGSQRVDDLQVPAEKKDMCLYINGNRACR